MGVGVVLRPGAVYQAYYTVYGFFEIFAFTEEDVREAFSKAQQTLTAYGIALAGGGIEFSRLRMDFSVYFTVQKDLNLVLWNQVFLKEANEAGFPDAFYNVVFGSIKTASPPDIPQPIINGVTKKVDTWLKWGLLGIGMIYVVPTIAKISKKE